MRNILPFLTRIPVKGDFEKARNELWAFPLVALVSSALPTLILYLGLPLSNLLAVLALYWTIGLLHLDGLADWADGIMAKGDRERKIEVMKDVNTGIAGLFAVVIVLLLQVYSLQLLPFYALFLAELNSKYAMLLALATKRPLGKGLGAYFMEGMNGRQLALGTLLYVLLGLSVVLFEPRALAGILGLLFGVHIIRISLKNFDGLNGDCLGATAEITRAGTLVVMALVWWYL
ncbi:cobalamin-5-phosphate synthase [Thermococcus kodakarensis KOD1]|uniref:Adenosylcobinamide-GDP ribazoletransferase n=1 Tax=Thermococcus kodakarensis (strain ATCC BAA-918 / JCM 12380 / KOD1) TaxID=69014 RepID=COBS_THEKO|nr:adenosylcobinamide-GDP ribazoletransferase [Thermococcus kodakarensis]Q52454.1 RecName: Full=Adenosylcobinamide-GDP ribazoletransferase; AltName: Full=Cobalamin synthase; AltName: Full=Cobalamin-5'-phosphate synthase [Thermococcus kodakarensis KOD1]BAA11941.1 cobalamin (5'-phosphate) synthase [Pyrococcus sp.]WCN28860.1 adenosylcobinamide-GDP ribazoletransferase [Thermococcus kodakarensis]WCN31162.1 adenosylcobinamide-GDP ribazoletransferase [Thermococcus kodakarensis]BAD85046.1 cobalamin-5-